MYATGVGLVMKGIEKYERDAKRGANTSKPFEEKLEGKPVQKVAESTKKEKVTVTGHSKQKAGDFFGSLISKAKDWMSDDVE